MLTIQKRIAGPVSFDEEVVLSFDARQKCRLRTQTTAGEDVALVLARGEVLRDGDLFEADDGRVVRVTARPEPLLQIACDGPVQLARIAYHLGNRHVSVQIGDGWLRIADDDVLRQMVEGLGANAVRVQSPFEPESGAYGGAHRHTEAPVHGGIIHEYRAWANK